MIPPIRIIGDIILKCWVAKLISSGEPAEIISPIILSAKKNPKTAKIANTKNVIVKNVLYRRFTASLGFSFISEPISLENTATAAL